MAEKKFPVVEIFGPTIQGEGALAGMPSHFIRFGGCDYRCFWCDSAHAVIPELVKINSVPLTAHEIRTRVRALEGRPMWVTLSGGNPALLELDTLVRFLQQDKYRVAIETQGTKFHEWLKFLDLVTISPKGPTSTNVTTPEVLGKFLEDLGDVPPVVVLKVVVFNEEDYEYAKQVHTRFDNYPMFLSVGTYSGGLDGTWTLPDGSQDSAASLSARYRWLSEKVAADMEFRDTTVLPQLHYLMWGSEKGR